SEKRCASVRGGPTGPVAKAGIMSVPTRRDFIAQAGTLGGALAIGSAFGITPSDVLAQSAKKKLGWALCGLGGLSENQIAPALQKAKFSRLAGVITDT